MKPQVMTIDGCTPLKQTLESRPPFATHVTAIGLVALLVTATVWAAVTPANLVVRATGRVRPATPPVRVFAPASGRIENRVARAYVQEGHRVHKGQLLLEFDSQRLRNEIARHERTIQTGQEELARMTQLGERLAQQHEAAQAKAETELAQARNELARARQTQASDVRRAEAELAAAQDAAERNDKLATSRTITEAAHIESQTKLRLAEEKLATARLPLDETRAQVLERALELVDRDQAVKVAELAERRTAKQGEVAAANKDLDNLKLQLAQATLRAPIDGVVIKGRHHDGDLVESGKAAFEIASASDLCFESYVASEDVGRLRNAMPSRIKFDAFDFQRYGTLPGDVRFISPDSTVPSDAGAKTPVYVVRIGLAGNQLVRGELRGEVKLGMAGTVEIVTDRRTILSILVKRMRSAISLG